MNEQVEKYILGKMEIDERISFLRELEKNKEMREEFSRYQNTDALFAFSDDVVDKNESVQSYNAFILRKRRNVARRYALRAASYAAAIVLLVLSVHFYHVYNYQRQLLASDNTSLFVPAGQRMCLTLADGTVVWLNAQSRLTYPAAFIGNERRVSIEGEAYFEVAKDAKKPFIVTAGELEMKVLGTVFNVHSYPEETLSFVSLLEGSLQVYKKEFPDKNVTLISNQEVVFEGNTLKVGKIPSVDYFLWKDGIYSFDDESLGNILKKMELYYDINIEVQDSDMLDWEYTAKFRQRDGIDEILRLLCKIHPFNIDKDEENNLVKISKYNK